MDKNSLFETFDKVQGYPDLRKDPRTGMIVDINRSKAKAVKAAREKRLKERAEVDQLKADVSIIKSMLGKLLEKMTNA